MPIDILRGSWKEEPERQPLPFAGRGGSGGFRGTRIGTGGNDGEDDKPPFGESSLDAEDLTYARLFARLWRLTPNKVLDVESLAGDAENDPFLIIRSDGLLDNEKEEFIRLGRAIKPMGNRISRHGREFLLRAVKGAVTFIEHRPVEVVTLEALSMGELGLGFGFFDSNAAWEDIKLMEERLFQHHSQLIDRTNLMRWGLDPGVEENAQEAWKKYLNSPLS